VRLSKKNSKPVKEMKQEEADQMAMVTFAKTASRLKRMFWQENSVNAEFKAKV